MKSLNVKKQKILTNFCELTKEFKNFRLNKFPFEATFLFCLVLTFSLVFAFLVPLGAGHDEVAHVLKADATSKLDIFPEEHKFIDENGKPSVIYRHWVSLTLADYSSLSFNTRNQNRTEELVSELREKGGRPYESESGFVDAWGAAGYNGIAYVPNAIGFKLARILNLSVVQAMYLSRSVAAFAYSLLVFMSFWILRKYKTRYLVFVVALFLPITASFSAISADGFLNAFSILFVALLMRGVLDGGQPSVRLKLATLIVAIILPLAKLPYLVMSLLVLASPVVTKSKHKVWLASSFVAVLLSVNFGWNYIVRGANELQSFRVSCCAAPANQSEQVNYILRNPVGFTKTLVKAGLTFNLFDETGRIAQQLVPKNILNRDLQLVYILLMLIVSCLLVKEVSSAWEKQKVFFMSMAVLVILTALGIVVALYVAANSVGQNSIWGVQARYFLPLTPFVLLLSPIYGGWIKEVRLTSKLKPTIMFLTIVINLLTVIAYFLTIEGFVSW